MRVFCLVLLFCTVSNLVLAAKPVAVVSGRFQYDLNRIKYLLPETDFVWEDKGAFLDPKEFHNYSIVVWFSGSKALDAEQVADFKKYIESGGVFLKTGIGFGIPRKEQPWFGVKIWRYHGNGKPPRIEGEFLKKDHPFFSGIDTSKSYSWMKGYYSIMPSDGCESLIGKNGLSLFCVKKIGKGRYIWLWEGLFRTRATQKTGLFNNLAFEKIFLNIIASANPLTVPQQLKKTVPALKNDPSALICWKRDWLYGAQKDYVFSPVSPLPTDYFNKFNFHSAMNERDTQFFLCQSLLPQKVSVALAPLRKVVSKSLASKVFAPITSMFGEKEKAVLDRLKLFVSDKPPLVPSLVRKGRESLPTKLGRFILAPVKGDFTINDCHPRVLWLELSTHGMEPGEYRSNLTLKGEKGFSVELPIRVKVYPVEMPDNRIVKLYYWGGSIPNRDIFLAERKRQGCEQLDLTYPALKKIKILGTGQSVWDAMRKNPNVFSPAAFPKLDFREVYDDALLDGIANGLKYIQLHDVRTGRRIGAATLDPKTRKSAAKNGVKKWPEKLRKIYSLYYKSLCEYVRERGFDNIDNLFGDEPSMNFIRYKYVPRAKLHAAAGLGSGLIWTAPGFMTPEDVNISAPYTTDWSIYTIGLPNFLKFWRAGKLKTHPCAQVGIPYGGCGYALRNPYAWGRNLAWNVIYQGHPVSFIRVGPIWKEWLYYVDFDTGATSRPAGVEGERLIAYGGPDRMDPNTPLRSSSYWEAARDGVDDANLARILEWYQKNLAPLAPGNSELAQSLKRVETDKATWFENDSPDGFKIVKRHYHHLDKASNYLSDYDYVSLQPPSSTGMELMKKRILDDLDALRPFARLVKGSLYWHDWNLVAKGAPIATIFVSTTSGVVMDKALSGFSVKCADLCGSTLPVARADSWKSELGKTALVVGSSKDPLVASILKTNGWKVDDAYPGPGKYLIKRSKKDSLLLIAGTDMKGAVLGLRNFSVFLRGEGNWLK